MSIFVVVFACNSNKPVCYTGMNREGRDEGGGVREERGGRGGGAVFYLHFFILSNTMIVSFFAPSA